MSASSTLMGLARNSFDRTTSGGRPSVGEGAKMMIVERSADPDYRFPLDRARLALTVGTWDVYRVDATEGP